MYAVNRTRGTYLGINIKVMRSFRARLVGLHAYRQLHFGDGAWLAPCNSIHTIGLRYSIDAIFLDSNGRVVRIFENVAPRRVIWPVRGASSVLELPTGVARSSETQVGDWVELLADAARADAPPWVSGPEDAASPPVRH